MTKKEKEKEEKVVNLCLNKKAPPHNYLPSEIDIVIVNPDGSIEKIGEGLTCAASGMENDTRWECWKSPNIFSKKKNFPPIMRKDCIAPSYWLRWAWHFVKLDNGRIVDFNSVNCIPTGDQSKFTIQTRSILAFRTKYPTPEKAIQAAEFALE